MSKIINDEVFGESLGSINRYSPQRDETFHNLDFSELNETLKYETTMIEMTFGQTESFSVASYGFYCT